MKVNLPGLQTNASQSHGGSQTNALNLPGSQTNASQSLGGGGGVRQPMQVNNLGLQTKTI